MDFGANSTIGADSGLESAPIRFRTGAGIRLVNGQKSGSGADSGVGINPPLVGMQLKEATRLY